MTSDELLKREQDLIEGENDLLRSVVKFEHDRVKFLLSIYRPHEVWKMLRLDEQSDRQPHQRIKYKELLYFKDTGRITGSQLQTINQRINRFFKLGGI